MDKEKKTMKTKKYKIMTNGEKYHIGSETILYRIKALRDFDGVENESKN